MNNICFYLTGPSSSSPLVVLVIRICFEVGLLLLYEFIIFGCGLLLPTELLGCHYHEQSCSSDLDYQRRGLLLKCLDMQIELRASSDSTIYIREFFCTLICHRLALTFYQGHFADLGFLKKKITRRRGLTTTIIFFETSSVYF